MSGEGQELSPREQAIVELASGRGALTVSQMLGVEESAVRRVGALLGWPQDARQIKRAASAIRAGERLWVGDLDDRPGDAAAVGGQAQPAPEATTDEPDDVLGCPEGCGGCSCHLGHSAPCNHCTDNHNDIDGAHSDIRCVLCDEPANPFARWPEGRPLCSSCAGLMTPATPEPIQGDPMPTITPDEAADTLAVLADCDMLGTRTGTDRATLTMPLGRLVDVDGTETVLAVAVVEVQLVKGQVLAALDDEQVTVPPFCWTAERQLTPEGETAIRALAALLPQDVGQ